MLDRHAARCTCNTVLCCVVLCNIGPEKDNLPRCNRSQLEKLKDGVSAYLHGDDCDFEDDRQKVQGIHIKAGPKGCCQEPQNTASLPRHC